MYHITNAILSVLSLWLSMLIMLPFWIYIYIYIIIIIQPESFHVLRRFAFSFSEKGCSFKKRWAASTKQENQAERRANRCVKKPCDIELEVHLGNLEKTPTLFWHSLTFYLQFFLGIPSDTFSDILSAVYSGSIWHVLWHFILAFCPVRVYINILWHSIWHA